MRRFIAILILLSALLPLGAEAANARIIKVLPHYLDAKGRHSLSPSLYERDAYQAQLRQHAERRSGIQFTIQWKAKKIDWAKARMRVEMRGVEGNVIQNRTIEAPVTKNGWFNNWSTLALTGEDYKAFGELVAWRATLWDGDQQIGEQKSFLW
jgi:hypothetical protein